LCFLLIFGTSIVSAYPAAAPSGYPILFDFSEYQYGDILDASSPYIKDGVEMTVELESPGSTAVIVFDSGAPTGGDIDLGAPNAECLVPAPRPGIGVGGVPASPGANCTPLGNGLVIANDLIDVVNNDTGQGGADCSLPAPACDGRVDEPNDNAGGGVIRMTFRNEDDGSPLPVDVNGFELLDIEANEAQALEIDFYSDVSCETGINTISATGFGDNSYEQFQIFEQNVECIRVLFYGSGSIPGILVVPSDTETAGLGNYVWWDEDGAGVQDDGNDHGVNGVVVNLYRVIGGTPEVTPFRSTTTANGGPYSTSGYYEFLDLDPADDYVVEFVLPDPSTGYTGFTIKNSASATATKDSDANPTDGFSDLIELDPGEFDFSVDAGLVKSPLGCIGDMVWHDATAPFCDATDNQTCQNEDQTTFGLNDVTVRLFRQTGSETFEQVGEMQTQTNPDDGRDGWYEFCELPEGNYIVDVNEVDLDAHFPDGWILTSKNDPYPSQTADPGVETINLGQGEIYESADFGYDDLGDLVGLGDYVWWDKEPDGILDPSAGELPIPCVTVWLYDANGVQIGQTNTDSWGFYGYFGLPTTALPEGYSTAPDVNDPDIDNFIDFQNGSAVPPTCSLVEDNFPSSTSTALMQPMAEITTNPTATMENSNIGGTVDLTLDFAFWINPTALSLASFEVTEATSSPATWVMAAAVLGLLATGAWLLRRRQSVE